MTTTPARRQVPASGQRLRVRWLIQGLNLGGAERLLLTQARLRDREHFDFSLDYVDPALDALSKDFSAVGVPVLCLGGTSPYDLRWPARLRADLLARPVDVLHTHTPYVAALARVVVGSMRQHRPRLVHTEHSPWPSHRWLTRLADGTTYVMNDVSVAVSESVRMTVPSRFRNAVRPLPHDVDPAAVQPARAARAAVRARLGLREGDMLIGTVANVRTAKAYEDLFEALKVVAARLEHVTFCAVGYGTDAEEVRSLARRLGLDERLHLAGPRADALEYISALDIFVLASRTEGMPVALMEARALGVPVVSTSVGGVPQALTHEEDGLLVEPAQPQLLGEAILRLILDEDLREKLGRSSERRPAGGDARSWVRDLESLYLEVAGRAGAPGRRRSGRQT